VVLPPLRFHPLPRPVVWGGRRLEALFGRALPAGEPIGESWDLADLPDAQSVVADGPLGGRTLADLVREHAGELLGEARPAAGRFPLLVKLLTTEQALSVQVHPDAGTAARLGGAAKAEAWFVLAAAPGARLYLGLRPGTRREALRRALADGTVESLLVAHEPRPGDTFHVAPGTVHALGPGLVIVEVQEPSDTTWRVFDWGRVGLDGRPRELHVARALEAIDFDGAPPEPAADGRVACEAFEAAWVRGGGAVAEACHPRVVVATSPGALEHEGLRTPLAAGETVLLPACASRAVVHDADFVVVEVSPRPQDRG